MSTITRFLNRLVVRLHVLVLRLTGFRLGARFGGMPVAIVTSVGAKSRKKRAIPLLYHENGDDYVFVASAGGSPHHPAWYHNLVAHPRARVETSEGTFNADARVAAEEERAGLWPEIIERYPGYARYQEKTDRHIPLLVLTEHRDELA